MVVIPILMRLQHRLATRKQEIMEKLFRYLIFSVAGILFWSNTQAQVKDSVVQLYGVVMTADSLQGIPGASIYVEGKGRGTIANDQGVFSIAVLKGDKIRFTSVGYKDKLVMVPTNMESKELSVIQLMVTDTAYLPATIIKPRPTREQFERDFVNTSIPADAYEVARQNTDEAKRRVLIASLPADGRESVNMQMRQQAAKYYYQGQQQPINLFNPMAWAEFIQAWKRGDFKSKK